MRYTRAQFVSYLVDVLGYSEDQDCEELSYEEMKELIEDINWQEFVEYSA